MGLPHSHSVDRNCESGNGQDTSHQQTQFKVDVAEETVQQGIWRMQAFGNSKQFREDRKRNGLEAEQNCDRGIEQRVHIERDITHFSRLGEKP